MQYKKIWREHIQFIWLSIPKSQVKCRNPGVPGCQYGANNVGWLNMLGALTYTLYSIYFIHYIFYIMQWRPNILWALPVAVSPHYDPIRGSPLLPRINISLCVHKRRHYFPNMSIDRRRRTDAPTVIAIGFVPLPISKLSTSCRLNCHFLSDNSDNISYSSLCFLLHR